MSKQKTLNRSVVFEIVASCLRKIWVESSVDNAEAAEIKGVTPIYTDIEGGVSLDSLGLVTLTTEIEERIEDDHGILISLVSDKAMSQTRNPFSTVDTLTNWAMKLISEKD